MPIATAGHRLSLGASLLLFLAAAPCYAASPVKAKKQPPIDLLSGLMETQQFGEIRDCRYAQKGQIVSIISQKQFSDELLQRRAGIYLNYTLLGNRQARAMKSFMLYDGDRDDTITVQPGPNWQYALDVQSKRLAICRRLTEHKEPKTQIELWDLTQESLSNAFKADASRCSGRFLFNKGASKLALLSDEPMRRLEVWDVATSTKEVLPEVLHGKRCHHLSEDFTAVYCSDEHAPLGSYKLSDGTLNWRLDVPDEYKLGRGGRVVRFLYGLVGRPLPERYFNLLQLDPLLLELDEGAKKAYAVYRYPSERKLGRREQAYPGLVLTIDLEKGELLEQRHFKEPSELRFARLFYDKNEQRLIGEDLHHSSEDFTSFYVFDLPGQGQQRLGLRCASAWDLREVEPKLLSCGVCNGKNSLQVWNVKAQLSLPPPPPAPVTPATVASPSGEAPASVSGEAQPAEGVKEQ